MSVNSLIANPEKPQLVLLHGWGMNSEVWKTIYPRWTPYFQINRIDLPGYGSTGSKAPKTLSAAAAYIANQFAGPIALLGWSLGGLIAMQIACDFPEKVTHLITLAASPCFIKQANWNGLNPELFDRFQQQLLGDPKRTLDRFIGLQTLGAQRGLEDSRFLRKLLEAQPLPSTQVLQRGLEWLQRSDLRAHLAQITAPVLMIYGDLDHVVPYQYAQPIHFRHPRSKTHRLAMAGHVPFLSDPDEVSSNVVNFLMSN